MLRMGKTIVFTIFPILNKSDGDHRGDVKEYVGGFGWEKDNDNKERGYQLPVSLICVGCIYRR